MLLVSRLDCNVFPIHTACVKKLINPLPSLLYLPVCLPGWRGLADSSTPSCQSGPSHLLLDQSAVGPSAFISHLPSQLFISCLRTYPQVLLGTVLSGCMPEKGICVSHNQRESRCKHKGPDQSGYTRHRIPLQNTHLGCHMEQRLLVG